MDNATTTQFYQDIGNVCRKFGVKMFAGIYIVDIENNDYGYMRLHGLMDKRMAHVCDHVIQNLMQIYENRPEPPQPDFIIINPEKGKDN